MERYLELHSEFRNRFLLFHMADGSRRDSRQVNWRRVEWPQVVSLEARIRNCKHVVHCRHVTFQFFMFHQSAQWDADRFGNPRKRRFWNIGWTDGEYAYMKEIDFKTGMLHREYKQPLLELASHIHPKVQGTVAGNRPGTRTEADLGYDS